VLYAIFLVAELLSAEKRTSQDTSKLLMAAKRGTPAIFLGARNLSRGRTR